MCLTGGGRPTVVVSTDACTCGITSTSGQAGEGLALVSAMSARNDARALFTGSIDMCSDGFIEKNTNNYEVGALGFFDK